jgi:cell division protein FtsB
MTMAAKIGMTLMTLTLMLAALTSAGRGQRADDANPLEAVVSALSQRVDQLVADNAQMKADNAQMKANNDQLTSRISTYCSFHLLRHIYK